MPLFGGAATKLRLLEQGCGCSTVRGGGRLKVRACLYLWHYLEWRVLATTTSHTCRMVFAIVRWCCHEAPTDRARLRIAAAPRCEAEADSKSVLVSASGTHLSGECLPPRPATLAGWCLPLFGGAVTKLRLIEQGWGCSTHGARRRQTQSPCSSSLPLALT